jgi:hypothetical protein
MIPCETCTKEIPTPEDAHSMVVVLQKVTPYGYFYYQCEDGAEVNTLTFQHWYCSHEEMVAGVKECINEHHLEEKLIAIPPTQVRLHKTVLKAGLRCKMCGAPLQSVAYRFCLTHAEPVNSVPDDSMNELGEWCCSLEHARQSALSQVLGDMPGSVGVSANLLASSSNCRARCTATGLSR